ncbi:ketosteroid isomerase-like protein [Paraburkholderia sp. GAS41]|uniref:nuclear transport factor 2 family protein n=1 Tax=Paraburkholderia sp. GAS41 TaxID=3035134 RepID=UPI003D2529D5
MEVEMVRGTSITNKCPTAGMEKTIYRNRPWGTSMLLQAPEKQTQISLDAIIERMFEAVDSRNFARLPDFFHAQIAYERPGYETIDGLSALMHFYEKVRIIAEGRHTLHSFFQSELGGVAVCGSFYGKSRSGNALNEQFCDVYLFEKDKIVRRKTFFFREAI